jgi:hypothetical protein
MQDQSTLELTILMPCLNEAETLSTCIRQANDFLRKNHLVGEILVADNGSADGSREIAAAEGAKTVLVQTLGYGAAALGGITAAEGRYVIMGDADASYDFSSLMPFLERLRTGADLVIGNRFRGGIEPNAMPLLHRYVGNPILSWLGRLLFSAKIHDFHCGLRGFNRDRICQLDLRTTGMEFASEMVVRAILADYRVEEVPTKLRKDGRFRPSHLKTWRDGWRHLRFFLIYSPRWLFLYPGLFLIAIGLAATVALLPGPVEVGDIAFDVHTFIVACFAILVGLQSVSFAVVSRRLATARGLIPASVRFASILDLLTLEVLLSISLVIGLVGMGGVIWSVAGWASVGFGPLDYAPMLRRLILSMTAVAVGIQLALTAFLSAIMEIPAKEAIMEIPAKE